MRRIVLFLLLLSHQIQAQKNNSLVFTFDFDRSLREAKNLCEPLEITGKKGNYKEINVPNMRPSHRVAYEFATNSGLALSKDAMNKLLMVSQSYTVEMFFRYDDGDLNVYKAILGDKSNSFAGKFIHMLYTRDAESKLVKIYLNGDQVTSYLDTNDDMKLSENSNMLFFQSNDSKIPSSPGAVSRIRIFAYVLQNDEIKLLDGASQALLPKQANGEILKNKITVKNIHFIQSKAEPLSSSQDELEDLAATLAANPAAVVELSGHTDNQGDFDLNLKLSKERVEFVKNFLISKGISASRITGKGYGCILPVASNWQEITRQENRRVEVKIMMPI